MSMECPKSHDVLGADNKAVHNNKWGKNTTKLKTTDLWKPGKAIISEDDCTITLCALIKCEWLQKKTSGI